MNAVATFLQKEWGEVRQYLVALWRSPAEKARLLFVVFAALYWGFKVADWFAYLYGFEPEGIIHRVMKVVGGALCFLYALMLWWAFQKPVAFASKLAAGFGAIFALLLGFWVGETMQGSADWPDWRVFLEGTLILWFFFVGTYSLGAAITHSQQYDDGD